MLPFQSGDGTHGLDERRSGDGGHLLHDRGLVVATAGLLAFIVCSFGLADVAQAAFAAI